MGKRTHHRSSSCDVKIIRSNSRDYDSDYKVKRCVSRCHSRNNSKDLEQDFRQKLTQNKHNPKSNDHSMNIKYILNYLNSDPKDHACAASSSSVGHAHRGHNRNNSYDQIYMPNNIKIDHELTNKFYKNSIRKNSRDVDVNLIKNNAAKEYLDSKLLVKNNSNDVNELPASNTVLPVAVSANPAFEPKFPTHSRNNSKDLTTKPLTMLDDPNVDTILRHRRTNSKDLNRVIDTGSKHRRNSSQHKIQIDAEQELQLLSAGGEEIGEITDSECV